VALTFTSTLSEEALRVLHTSNPHRSADVLCWNLRATVIGSSWKILTMFGKRIARFSIRQQFQQSFSVQILLIISIVPATHALAGSSSAPLAVTVSVVRSCNVSTVLSLAARNTTDSANAKTNIEPDPIVTILCPHGFDPAITVRSGNYASDAAMTRTREPRVMSLPEPIWDAEKGSYGDSVRVTINF
jgi:hypothetical protein